MNLPRLTLSIENAFYEYRYGITTHGLYGFVPGDWSQAEHIYSGTMPYRWIFSVLDDLALAPTDVFVDLGCGKGRVVCCASLYPCSSVIGVDDTTEMCATAESNISKMRGRQRAPAKIVCGKVEEFNYNSGTVFYMFHAFGPKTLAVVLARIQESLQQLPRAIRIVYVNPRHEPVLQSATWLECYRQRSGGGSTPGWVGYRVSYWRPRSDFGNPT